MASVKKSKDCAVSAETMWKKIGDFHTFHSWHPAIKSSQSMEGGKVRVLTLADGARMKETHLGKTAMSYTYRIDESPLPVRNYVATLSVQEANPSSCTVVWEATFEPHGAPEPEACETIGGIFQAGLDSL